MKGVREHLSEVVDLRLNLSNNDNYRMTVQGIPILRMRSLSLICKGEGTQHGQDPQRVAAELEGIWGPVTQARPGHPPTPPGVVPPPVLRAGFCSVDNVLCNDVWSTGEHR